MASLSKINLGLLWACVAGTASGTVWTYNNIAWAADVERIEVRLIKQELRDLRKELRDNPDDEMLKELIEELLDDLCEIKPEDREC